MTFKVASVKLREARFGQVDALFPKATDDLETGVRGQVNKVAAGRADLKVMALLEQCRVCHKAYGGMYSAAGGWKWFTWLAHVRWCSADLATRFSLMRARIELIEKVWHL